MKNAPGEIDSEIAGRLIEERLKQYSGENKSPYRNLLLVSKQGTAVYFSRFSAFRYKFDPETNSFKLLLFLAQNPRELISFDNASVALNKPKFGGEDSTAERRVRDNVKVINQKLGIPHGSMISTKRGVQLNASSGITNINPRISSELPDF